MHRATIRNPLNCCTALNTSPSSHQITEFTIEVPSLTYTNTSKIMIDGTLSTSPEILVTQEDDIPEAVQEPSCQSLPASAQLEQDCYINDPKFWGFVYR
ncbi:11169_t:CDS:2 [Funneliformis geosporum]|nr:11169_t:CDS:2 [Funneliformis geosporum]